MSRETILEVNIVVSEAVVLAASIQTARTCNQLVFLACSKIHSSAITVVSALRAFVISERSAIWSCVVLGLGLVDAVIIIVRMSPMPSVTIGVLTSAWPTL